MQTDETGNFESRVPIPRAVQDFARASVAKENPPVLPWIVVSRVYTVLLDMLDAI